MPVPGNSPLGLSLEHETFPVRALTSFSSHSFSNTRAEGLVFAYGRVNDPMAKQQFLRVGSGGMGWDDDFP